MPQHQGAPFLKGAGEVEAHLAHVLNPVLKREHFSWRFEISAAGGRDAELSVAADRFYPTIVKQL